MREKISVKFVTKLCFAAAVAVALAGCGDGAAGGAAGAKNGASANSNVTKNLTANGANSNLAGSGVKNSAADAAAKNGATNAAAQNSAQPASNSNLTHAAHAAPNPAHAAHEQLLLAPQDVKIFDEKSEWFGGEKTESINTFEYAPNAPHSPAAWSHISAGELTPQQQAGQKIYAKWCSACHGVGMPGTRALGALYGADLPAVLEDRTDLSADAVRLFVRNGKHSMPFFRSVEINEDELDALADYLSRNAE